MTERKDDELNEVTGGADWKIGLDDGGSGGGTGSGDLQQGDGGTGDGGGGGGTNDGIDTDNPSGGDKSSGMG